MNEFTIRDLENLSGIKAHTIRIWEQRYSLFKPRRTATNIRYYNSEDLRTLLNIALLNKFGFRISQIDKMSREEISEKVLTLSQFEAYQEKVLNELVLSMISLDVFSFEEKINKYILLKGFDQAIRKLIFSFLERIGLLWMTSHINAAQEHLVTQVIRQKLISAIDKIPYEPGNTVDVLMFLPEGEQHELGLMYVHYLAKAAGSRVLYLGSNLPVEDLAFAVRTTNPWKIYSHITFLPGKNDMQNFIRSLEQLLPGKEFIFSGTLSGIPLKKLPPNIHHKKSLSEVMEALVPNQPA